MYITYINLSCVWNVAQRKANVSQLKKQQQYYKSVFMLVLYKVDKIMTLSVKIAEELNLLVQAYL